MNKVFDQLKNMGEEKLGQLVAKLLSNEKFVQGVQVLVSKSLEAKEMVDKQVQVLLGAMGLPTAEEYRNLIERLESVEEDLDVIKERLGKLEQKNKSKAKKKASPKKS
ncbi:MAG: hypothetical protein GXP49_17565 [Deltaproteobacteria bacterium]|nr:hypothetical protein [Deltaproteobacteria bacterium]